MCHVGLLVSVEVCVYIHVSCWFTGVCGGLCVYMCQVSLQCLFLCVCVSMCYVSLQASVEVCVYPLMREAYAEGLMGQ